MSRLVWLRRGWGFAARGSQLQPVHILQDRERRNLKDIHRHVKTAKKCIEWAGKILDRYEVSPAGICYVTCVFMQHSPSESSVHLVFRACR